MTRTVLHNEFRKDRSNENSNTYEKQQKFCVKLLKTTKKNFQNNLDVKEISGHKLFLKTVKPNFPDKTLKDEIITLVKVGKIILEKSGLVKHFYNYF